MEHRMECPTVPTNAGGGNCLGRMLAVTRPPPGLAGGVIIDGLFRFWKPYGRGFGNTIDTGQGAWRGAAGHALEACAAPCLPLACPPTRLPPF